MTKPELHLIDTHSQLGELVDSTHLIQATKTEAMDGLTAGSIAEHAIGIYLTEGIGKNVPAVGYVACKRIISKSIGMIGGLYVMPRYRDLGLAKQLTHEVTNRTFANNPDISFCQAYCNELSASVFKSIGYVATEIRASDNKILYTAAKAEW